MRGCQALLACAVVCCRQLDLAKVSDHDVVA
jgi:hypothetical protein